MNIESFIRFFAGVTASIGVLFVLDLLLWKTDIGELESVPLYAVVSASAGISMFVAAFVGAFVARTNFIGPALIIAFGVWYLAGSFLEVVLPKFEPSNPVFFWVTNVGGVLLTVGTGMLGAAFGRRFSMRNATIDSNAA
jgi:hypothetical protein